MNETVLNLAFRIAVLLKSTHQDEPGEIHLHTITKYFEKLGININDSGHSSGLELNTKLVDDICREINNKLRNTEKICLLLLVQDCLLTMHDINCFTENLNQIFNCIGIDGSLINKFSEFLKQDDLLSINNRDYLLLSPRAAMEDDMPEGSWIEDNAPRNRAGPNMLDPDQFDSHLLVMFVDQIKSYVIRCINKTGPLFDEDTEYQCRFRLLGPGNDLSLRGIPVLTFSGLKSRFLQLNEMRELTLTLDRIRYMSAKGIREIDTFSANETTGQLIGIVGREGVGKSTLLKLLAGKIKPFSGSISINGYDLWKYKYLLKGIIGFVPEEDLLFEDLSVSDNLSLTARLYYSSLSIKEIDAKVNALLSKLDLLELKHVVVGVLNSKHIQPGQRRMINIALELLREPQILLVDNALSGLGLSDASKVIKVLHDYSFNGNLVITTISQADSSTFMLFDKIWILDEGGHAVYSGSVKAANGYLLRSLNLTYQDSDKVDPAQLLDLVNYRLPDKNGNVWKRVLEPQEWHNRFMRDQLLHEDGVSHKSLLPARILKIPNLEVQLLIFSIRNFKCKFSRINDIIKALVIGPVIALFIALLFRFSGHNGYSLLTNANIPVYQFVSVIVAVFLGLIASVDEIIGEKNILEKEEYLEFSRFSYLNSKILYLFPVIAIQVFLYVFTGNHIMGIRELFWVYWSVLFSAAGFGVLLGLVFSAGVHSRSFLHKGLLPFVIAVQMLLGGGLIAYDQLNLGSNKYTPLLGDLMVSRWGYEALAVEQFKSNTYEKLIYAADSKIDQASFYTFQVVPKLEESLAFCRNSTDNDSLRQFTELLQHELRKVALIPDVFQFEYLNNLPEIKRNAVYMQETSDYLTYLGLHFNEQYQNLAHQKSMLAKKLGDSIGINKLAGIREDYHNLALEKTVTNSTGDKEYSIMDNEIVRNKGAIFQAPASNWGRARLFSPVKIFNGQQTETLWFNITIIWLLAAICYVWVLFDITGFIRKALRIYTIHRETR
jgi:ABC-type multidrug transport system ATPase subunit